VADVDLVSRPNRLDQSVILLAKSKVFLDEALVLLWRKVCGRLFGVDNRLDVIQCWGTS
jgi:hypothetical protein